MDKKYHEVTTDELGRIIIPKELRSKIGVKAGDALAVTLIDGEIALFPKMCFFCQCHDPVELYELKETYICQSCMKSISNNEFDENYSECGNEMRKLDELGRIVLPTTTRRKLGIIAGDKLFIYLEESALFIKPAVNSCRICHEKDNLQSVGKLTLCTDCMEQISSFKEI